MCGIAGLGTRDGLRESDGDLVDRMLRARSPIAARTTSTRSATGRAMIGARRLAIIDLDGGRQPLTDESGLILATQNGEIYNYVELRDDLDATRPPLPDAQRHRDDRPPLRGVRDRLRRAPPRHVRDRDLGRPRRARLVLARDRLGKKPLYWRLADGRLAYGSELKAILEDPTVERVVDREALGLYLQYQYVPAPRTILRGRREAAAGQRPDVGRRRAADRALLDADVRAEGQREPARTTSTRASRSSARPSGSGSGATSRSACS